MADAKVIVIEPSDSEAGALQALLRFLDLEPLHVHDLAELRQSPHGSSHDCLAIIVRKDTVAEVGGGTRRTAQSDAPTVAGHLPEQ